MDQDSMLTSPPSPYIDLHAADIRALSCLSEVSESESVNPGTVPVKSIVEHELPGCRRLSAGWSAVTKTFFSPLALGVSKIPTRMTRFHSRALRPPQNFSQKRQPGYEGTIGNDQQRLMRDLRAVQDRIKQLDPDLCHHASR